MLRVGDGSEPVASRSLSSIGNRHLQKSDTNKSLPWWFSGKEATCNVGATRDVGLIPGTGRSPGGGHDNPVQYSCLENPMDKGAWQATVHGVTQSQTWLK